MRFLVVPETSLDSMLPVTHHLLFAPKTEVVIRLLADDSLDFSFECAV